MNSATNNTPSNDNDAAHRLLRHEGFDSAKLSARTFQLERLLGVPPHGGGAEEKKDDAVVSVTTHGLSSARTSTRDYVTHLLRNSTSLSQLLSQHHEMCVNSAIECAARLESERRLKREEENEVVDYDSEERSLMLFGGNLGVVSKRGGDSTTTIVPKPQIVSPSVFMELVPFHVSSIEEFRRHRGKRGALDLITSLKRGMESNTAIMGESMHQYKNGLSLLESIVLSCDDTITTALTTNNIVVAKQTTNQIEIARQISSACHFFSIQFRQHMSDVAQEVDISLFDKNISNTVARDASIFSKVILGQSDTLWGAFYYCLRCGDLVAAQYVLKSNNTNNEVDLAVVQLVDLLADIQGGMESIFASNEDRSRNNNMLFFPTPTIVRARRAVSDLYEGHKTKFVALSPAEQTAGAYQPAVLAMLSGSESISEASVLESSGLVKTVEDYLYASLWHALHLAGDESLDNDGGLKRTCDAVARLGSLVKEWGPSYFEQEDGLDGTAVTAVALASQGNVSHKIPRSGGWAYALPLLACQQYGTALGYLAEVGGGLGLMQATHAAVVLDAVGVDLVDYTQSLDGTSEESKTLFPLLVSSFSASLQSVDVVPALKYLMLLSDNGKIMNAQVRRLILETRQFDILAGKVEQDGSRSKAALDEYFSAKEVSSILAEAAGDAVQAGKSADGAELLVLAGRYSSLFSLMNRELASHLAVTSADEEAFSKRQFWFNAATQFHNIHLTGGRNYVQSNLSDEGNLSLGNTFQLLLNLTVFFDRHRDQQWEDSWKLIDDLALFPRENTDMAAKMSQFNSFDGFVRGEFHHVVIASMEALCHLYRAAKQNAAGATAFQHSAIEQQLKELVRRARLLITFAGVINLPMSGEVDTYAKLAILEKNMM